MSSNNGHVLAMYVTGERLEKYKDLDKDQRDAKLGAACLEAIKKMFPVCSLLFLSQPTVNNEAESFISQNLRKHGSCFEKNVCNQLLYNFGGIGRLGILVWLDCTRLIVLQLFQHAADPMSTSISCWTSDHLTGMSRSYLPIGVDNLVYTNIGEPVSDQLFFAGEVRQINWMDMVQMFG